MSHLLRFLPLVALLLIALPAQAQDDPAPPAKSKLPAALTEYKGRRIAPAMSYLGADWLLRATREKEERCSLMLGSLGLKQGITVCDMGCGNGFYALQMGKLIGPRGRVYAVDIQPEMLKLLNERADEEEVTNITPILGTFSDPRLPKGSIDLILCVDVYHEFSHPEQMLKSMKEALSPTGLIVLVEFRGEDPEVPIKPEHKMTKAQVRTEMEANGLELAKEFDKLPWQHMLFYRAAKGP